MAEIIIHTNAPLGYIGVAHRHFEKAMPLTNAAPNIEHRLTIPIDLARLSLGEELTNAIETIEVVYKRQ